MAGQHPYVYGRQGTLRRLCGLNLEFVCLSPSQGGDWEGRSEDGLSGPPRGLASVDWSIDQRIKEGRDPGASATLPPLRWLVKVRQIAARALPPQSPQSPLSPTWGKLTSTAPSRCRPQAPQLSTRIARPPVPCDGWQTIFRARPIGTAQCLCRASDFFMSSLYDRAAASSSLGEE